MLLVLCVVVGAACCGWGVSCGWRCVVLLAWGGVVLLVLCGVAGAVQRLEAQIESLRLHRHDP